MKRESESTSSQSDKFKEAARELEADGDEKRWEERLRKIAKTRDVPTMPKLLREKPKP